MQNSNEASKVTTVGFIGAAIASAVVLFGVFYAKRSDDGKKSNTHTKLTLNTCHESSHDSVSDAMDRYTALIEKSGNELDIIAEAMGKIHVEFTVHKERVIAENNKLIAVNNQMRFVLASRSCVSTFSCFNEHKKDTSLQVRSVDQRKQELIDGYVHLSNTYPIAEFETLESPEQQKLITLSDVEKACADYGEHHQKVLDIAEQMLESCNVPLHEIRLLVSKIGTQNVI